MKTLILEFRPFLWRIWSTDCSPPRRIGMWRGLSRDCIITNVYYATWATNYPSHELSNSHSLQWRHDERSGVSNHWRHDCLLNRLFRRRSGKNQSSVSLAFMRRIHRWPMNSPHKGPVTRKLFSFDDVIMCTTTVLFKHSHKHPLRMAPLRNIHWARI